MFAVMYSQRGKINELQNVECNILLGRSTIVYVTHKNIDSFIKYYLKWKDKSPSEQDKSKQDSIVNSTQDLEFDEKQGKNYLFNNFFLLWGRLA